MFYWCYFDNVRCIKSVPESQSIRLEPIDVVILKSNGISRSLCDIPDNFNPVGKIKEELKEYIR